MRIAAYDVDEKERENARMWWRLCFDSRRCHGNDSSCLFKFVLIILCDLLEKNRPNDRIDPPKQHVIAQIVRRRDLFSDLTNNSGRCLCVCACFVPTRGTNTCKTCCLNRANASYGSRLPPWDADSARIIMR